MRPLILFILMLILSSTVAFTQSDQISYNLNHKYDKLTNLENRFAFIDSLDQLGILKGDSSFAILVEDIIDKKLVNGDTSDILGLFISFMNYHNSTNQYYNVIDFYNRIEKYIRKRKAIIDFATIKLTLANTYYFLGDLDVSNQFYLSAAETFEHLEETQNPYYGDAFLYSSDNLDNQGKFGEAALMAEKAKNIFLDIRDTTRYLWAGYSHLSILSNLELQDAVRSEVPDMLRLATFTKSDEAIYAIYSVLLYNHLKTDEYQEAIELGKELLSLCATLDEAHYCSNALQYLIKAYIYNQQIDSANYYYKIFLEKNQSFHKTRVHILNAAVLKAQIALANQNIEGAQETLFEYFYPYNDNLEENFLLEVLTLQYSIDTINKDYEKAHKTLVKIDKITHTRQVTTLKNQFAYHQVLFETNKRSRILAETNAQIASLALKTRTERLWYFGALSFLFFLLSIFLIRKRKFNSKKHETHQIEFNKKLLNAQEIERKRISRELHDGIGQSLVLINNQLQINDNNTADKVILQTIEEIKTVSLGLHPQVLEEDGITKALRDLIKRTQNSKNLKLKLKLDNIDNLIPPEHELNLYRIVQESLSNSIKHAEADQLDIEIIKDSFFINVRVKDNGRGFNIAKHKELFNSIGMRTMKERAIMSGGKLTIYSVPHRSTTVRLTIPYTGQFSLPDKKS